MRARSATAPSCLTSRPDGYFPRSGPVWRAANHQSISGLYIEITFQVPAASGKRRERRQEASIRFMSSAFQKYARGELDYAVTLHKVFHSSAAVAVVRACRPGGGRRRPLRKTFSKSSRAWRRKAIRSPSFISVKCTRKDWAPRRTSTRRYSGTNVPPPRAMRSRRGGSPISNANRPGPRKPSSAPPNASAKPRKPRRGESRGRRQGETEDRDHEAEGRHQGQAEGRGRSGASGEGKGRGRSQGATCQETGRRPGQARGAPARDSRSGPAHSAGACQGRRRLLVSHDPALQGAGVYFTRIPGWAPVSGERSNSLPPGPAASTMPSDIPNFILRGARFATTTVNLPRVSPDRKPNGYRRRRCAFSPHPDLPLAVTACPRLRRSPRLRCVRCAGRVCRNRRWKFPA